jgi:hypothetical protein
VLVLDVIAEIFLCIRGCRGVNLFFISLVMQMAINVVNLIISSIGASSTINQVSSLFGIIVAGIWLYNMHTYYNNRREQFH